MIFSNPTISPAQDGNLSISIHDPKLGNLRTVIASKEDCDKFIKERNEAYEKDVKIGRKYTLGCVKKGVGAGVILGAAIAAFRKASIITGMLNGIIGGAFAGYLTSLPKASEKIVNGNMAKITNDFIEKHG